MTPESTIRCPACGEEIVKKIPIGDQVAWICENASCPFGAQNLAWKRKRAVAS